MVRNIKKGKGENFTTRNFVICTYEPTEIIRPKSKRTDGRTCSKYGGKIRNNKFWEELIIQLPLR
jgi:hypothetical protein